MPASQITIRNVDDTLQSRLRELSKARGESLNKTVLRLLRAGVGVDERREALACYVSWDEEDVREFDRAVRDQRETDLADWE